MSLSERGCKHCGAMAYLKPINPDGSCAFCGEAESESSEAPIEGEQGPRP